MNIVSGLLGNATQVEPQKIQAEYKQLLAEGERVEKAYQLIRDLFFFTDKRLIMVDKQGVTGHKVEYRSIPYRSIVAFSVETAGHFDLNAELRIWMIGISESIHKQFNTKLNIYEVQSVLASYVLR